VHFSSPISRVASLGLFAALLTALFVFVVPSSASAHDELTGSEPAADSTVDAAPAQIVLTFSGDVLDAEGTTMLQVTDESGKSYVDAAPTVDGNTVTQPLAEGGPAGEYYVAWKVVSGDGHPIAGEYTFTATTGSAVTTPTPTPTPTPEQSTPTPTVTVTETPAPAPAPAPASPIWLWIALIAAILVLAGVAIWLGLRRKPTSSAASEDAASADFTSETER
jgi:methionine-rich copper-binding protein CopC